MSKDMPNYIITLEPHEQFDAKGNRLGMSEKLAVFYLPSIGRKRYYRQSISSPSKGLKLLEFKTKKAAQSVCDITNTVAASSAWKVEINNHVNQ